MTTTTTATPPGVIALAGVLTLLAACAPGTPEVATQIGVADSSLITPVPFDEVGTDDCLGATGPVEGQVPVADCAEPGALPVEAVVTLGADAPTSRPAPAVVAGHAAAACEPAVAAFADEHDIPVTGLLQVGVISDTDWSGPQTPVVCAVSQAE